LSQATRQEAAYAESFQGGEAVSRYLRKLNNRIDVLRDRQEVEILGRMLSGRVFDCTIGVGRLVGRLPLVREYRGMDISAEFVEYVRSKYPGIQVRVGDLTRGIDEPDNAYDSVLCLRSLSAIGQLDRILPEMLRIARPGGVVAVDYGRTARPELRVRGADLNIDTEDLHAAITKLSADVVERVPLDGILGRLKARVRVFRLVTGPFGRLLPDKLLMALEAASAPMFWQREIVLLRKR
jgi:SAM-dependent methyltransferase